MGHRGHIYSIHLEVTSEKDIVKYRFAMNTNNYSKLKIILLIKSKHLERLILKRI